MAKVKRNLAMLVNEEEKTHTKYIVTLPTKGQKAGTKLRLKKYDPVLQRHCWFSSKKLPSPKK